MTITYTGLCRLGFPSLPNRRPPFTTLLSVASVFLSHLNRLGTGTLMSFPLFSLLLQVQSVRPSFWFGPSPILFLEWYHIGVVGTRQSLKWSLFSLVDTSRTFCIRICYVVGVVTGQYTSPPPTHPGSHTVRTTYSCYEKNVRALRKRTSVCLKDLKVTLVEFGRYQSRSVTFVGKFVGTETEGVCER